MIYAVKTALKVALLGACMLCITSAQAHMPQMVLLTPQENFAQTGLTKDFTLLPNTPLSIVNPLNLSLIADCTVLNIGEQNNGIVAARVVKASGLVNQIEYTAGEFLDMPISVNEAFQIIAHPGAEVSLTNKESGIINARCIVSILR